MGMSMRYALIAVLVLLVIQRVGCDSSVGVDLSTIEDVIVVFMNHLDVGFNHGEDSNGIPCSSPYEPECGLSSSVVNNYFDNWYPKALRTAQWTRTVNETAGYTYTTHPWLLTLFLQCDPSDVPVWWDGIPIHCPSVERKVEMAQAVINGSIWWHSMPFNGEAELLDESLFLSMVNLTRTLSSIVEETLSLSRSDTPYDTLSLSVPITMSQRDVPGMTQSVIPLLRLMGVQFISVGVNSASSPPVVPHIFRWFDASQSDEIFVTYHPNGYGWMQGDRLDPETDCLLLEGVKQTLCIAFKGDNAGPQGIAELQEDYFQLRKTFPNAVVRSGTFDDFVPVLESVKEKLPIVTDEIGDTWLYGCPSDPKKLALFRALQRCRKTSLSLGEVNIDDLKYFDFFLMKNEEHTWGEDVKSFLADWSHWNNEDFHEQLAVENPNYMTIVNSWYDQRFFIDEALRSLNRSTNTHALYERCVAEVNEVSNVPTVNTSQWSVAEPSIRYSNGKLEISFNSTTGAISYLALDGRPSIATDEHQLATVEYTTYDGRDYGKYLSHYMYCPPPQCTWAPQDFGKPNMSISGHPKSTTAVGFLEAFYKRTVADSQEYLAILSLPNDAHVYAGAPEIVYVQYRLSSKVDIDVLLVNKTATRLAESMWVVFNPLSSNGGGEWRMDKLGSWVDPLNVVVNGSRSLHGIRYYVGLNSTWATDANPNSTGDVEVLIESVDAGIVAPGGDSLMNYSNDEPAVISNGMSFNLFNNIWGTNYVMWYPFGGESPHLRYRFSVVL